MGAGRPATNATSKLARAERYRCRTTLYEGEWSHLLRSSRCQDVRSPFADDWSDILVLQLAVASRRRRRSCARQRIEAQRMRPAPCSVTKLDTGTVC